MLTLPPGLPLAVARVAVGVYLVVHYLQLLPWSATLFSSAGMLPDASLNPAPFTPSPLAQFDAPRAVEAFVAGLVLCAIAYTAGFRTRTAGVLLGLGAAALWQRNMLTLNPSLAFLGFWFAVQTLSAPDPPFSVDRWLARGRPPVDRLPADVLGALWLVFGVAYSYSGWTKLTSPTWFDGSAVGRMLNGPIGLDGPLARTLADAPDPVLCLATWSVVAVELLTAPLALSRRLRPWVWLALLAMHVGLLVLVDLRDISWGMIVVHLFLFPGQPRSFLSPPPGPALTGLWSTISRPAARPSSQASLRAPPP